MLLSLKTNAFITYKHLERLFTSQEYFVWNKDDINKIIDSNEDIDEDVSAFWEIAKDFEEEEIDDYKYVEIIKNGFSLVNELFIDQIIKESKIENKKVLIIKEKSNELAFQKTITALKDENINWIINPVFIYQDMIIKPSLYKKDKQFIYSLLHSTKTKLINYLRAYFDYSVLTKLNVKVNEYFFYLYENRIDYPEPKQLFFYKTNYCWSNKTKQDRKAFEKVDLKEKEKLTIIEKLQSGIIKFKFRSKQSKKNKEIKNIETAIPEIILKLENFDEYVEQIRQAKEIKQFLILNQKDITPWGENPNFINLFDYKNCHIPKVCGYLLNKKNLLDLIYSPSHNIDYFKNKKIPLKMILNQENHLDYKKMIQFIQPITKSDVVWYDFEGFSMPYSSIAFAKPYQQIVFQVSIIRTSKEKEIFKDNIVIDPKELQVEDFVKIIKSIYWHDQAKYVVYNKNYELARIKEMIKMLKNYLDEKNDKKIVENLEHMAKIIENNTIDLLDLFRYSGSKDKVPPIFLHQLLGFSSIKKLEHYITDSKIQLKEMIIPYKELEVQNGLMAMNKAIQRYLDAIGDEEWNVVSQNLAAYCENDVRAMIMVYYFVKYLISKNTQK